jgi:hypothetical protein
MVVLGPRRYLAEQGVELKEGDEVRVRGSKAQGRDGILYILAREVTETGKGAAITLRDEGGFPNWAGGNMGRGNGPGGGRGFGSGGVGGGGVGGGGVGGGGVGGGGVGGGGVGGGGVGGGGGGGRGGGGRRGGRSRGRSRRPRWWSWRRQRRTVKTAFTDYFFVQRTGKEAVTISQASELARLRKVRITLLSFRPSGEIVTVPKNQEERFLTVARNDRLF